MATITLPGGGRAARLSRRGHAALVAISGEIELEESIRVVLLRARGSSFCVGDDGEVAPDDPDGIAALAAVRVPVVALLQGDVLDAGLELALACDVRLAAAGCRLGLTQVAHGVLPFHGGTQRLPRLVGYARALEMLLLGQVVGARRALTLGLVHRVVPPRSLERTARAMIDGMAARAPVAQRLAKESIRSAMDVPLAEGLRLEGDLYVLLQTTRDRLEGIASHRAKRKPRFTGH